MASDSPDTDGDSSGGSPDTNSYLKRAVRGSAWNVGQSVAAKITGLGVQWYLAILLFPSDFGLLAMAMGWVTIVGFVNPMSLGDLLVQRGAHFANAVTNTRRFALFGVITATIIIITLSPWLSTRHGQPIRMKGDVAVTSARPLGSIDSEPPINELFDQTPSSISLEIDDTTFQVSLPNLPPETTITEYGETLQREIATKTGDSDVRVTFDEKERHLVIRSDTDRTIAVTTHSTTPGSILENFGIPYVSIPLMMMMCLLTLKLLFEAIGVPYRAWMRKEMMFGPFAIMIFSTSLVAQIMTIIIAAMTGSPIALLMTILIPPILQAIVAYFLVRPLQVCAPAEREPLKRIASDSSLLMSAQWVHSVGLMAPPLVMALFLSTSEIGLYFWASAMASQFVQIMYGLTTGVLTPIFSTLQNEPKRLASAFLRTARISAGVSVPVFYSIAAIVPIAVPVFFTDRWSLAIPILLVLLVERSFSSGVMISGSLLKGSGRYKEWLIWQVGYSIVNLSLAAVIGSQYGVLGFAVATCVLGSISNFVGIKICLRDQVRWPQLLGIYILPILASVPLMGGAALSLWMDKTYVNLCLTAPFLILLSLGLYLVIIRLANKELYLELRKILDSVVLKRLTRR